MTADRELQERVLQALDREAAVAPGSIGVTVRGGIVTLGGQVATLAERWAVERVAGGVPGVRAIANDLRVSWNQKPERTNTVVAGEVARALSWTTVLPLGAVRAMVAEGWVTLAGTVDHERQRYAAERAVRQIAGVRGVSNVINVKEPASARLSGQRGDEQHQRLSA
jgi:osmotically-inducible protein OsmY